MKMLPPFSPRGGAVRFHFDCEIVGATVTASRYSGTPDPDASRIVEGAPLLSDDGRTVTQALSRLRGHANYRIVCCGHTADRMELWRTEILPCIP